MPTRRVLTIDAGGIRGISSLLILRDLMLRVAVLANNPTTDPDDPFNHFDLIVGTGTGGLIALMLGRLRMGINQCIAVYRNMAPVAFQPKSWFKSWFKSRTLCSAKNLESAIEDVVARSPKPQDFLLRDNHPKRIHTAVVATRSAGSTPQLFRSYLDHGRVGNIENCTISQAARATTAASDFYKPVTINHISYIDDSGRYNNPVKLAFDEARRIWPNDEITLLLSIGTGSIKPKGTHDRLSAAIGRLIDSCRPPEGLIQAQLRGLTPNPYFRFNVNQGLEDATLEEWTSQTFDRVHNYTAKYIDEHSSDMDECARRILGHHGRRGGGVLGGRGQSVNFHRAAQHASTL